MMTQSFRILVLLFCFPFVASAQDTTRIGAERPFRRSLTEVGSIYGVRALIYANTGALQDNDFSSWKLGFRERFHSKKPYRFDDNSLAINHLGHALLPGYETALFRSNGMSFSQSFALQFSASAVWEFVVEARETVSLNDVLVTPVAGATISETLYQYSQFFRRSKPNGFNRVAGIIFTGPMAFNYWVNGEKRTPSGEYDEHGFDKSRTHIFRDYIGAAALSTGGAQWDLGHEMKLQESFAIIAVGSYYGHPGKRRFSSTASTELGFRMNGGTSINEVMFYEHVMFTARSRSSYRLADEKITGSAMLYGLSSGYSLYNANFGALHDNIIALHMVGPALDLDKTFGKTRILLSSKLYADFASVYSIAFDDYLLQNGVDKNTVKSSLKGQNYLDFLTCV